MSSAPVNGIGPSLLHALNAQADQTYADESVAVVVLASDFKVFSAGADATWMRQVATEHGSDMLLDEFIRTMEGFRALSLRLRRAPFLVIAALNGHTLAGGLELAASCDLRFVADDEAIKIGVPEMDLFGQMPSGGGGVPFLARIMGSSQALQFILDAKPVSPQRALSLGLVDRLFPGDELLAETEAWAGQVAAKTGRTGVAATKLSVYAAIEQSMPEALTLDRAVHWDSVRRGDFAGTVQEFVKNFASSRS
jgi:enoyl-CoA hydratase/carnithine racemase